MKRHLDGAHWGLGDWYPEIERGIKRALKSKSDWTTDWYASKKEIASAKITRKDGVITVEVSVSDDFDTPGKAQGVCKKPDIDSIRKTIYKVWDEAIGNQKENREWMAWSIGHRSGPKHRGRKRKDWIETYVMDISDYGDDPSPPGDNYHTWGFQGDSELPKDVKKRLEAGMQKGNAKVFAGDFVADYFE